jgi:DNA-binding transcriptional LysR family regulator
VRGRHGLPEPVGGAEPTCGVWHELPFQRLELGDARHHVVAFGRVPGLAPLERPLRRFLVLKRYGAAHPGVLVTVRSGHSKEVLEMVLRGEAEIGLARSLHHPAVETLSLRDDPLILVQHRAHPLVRTRRVRLTEVAERPLIFFDRGSSDWTLTHGLFRRAGLVPNVVLEVETIETAKKMVERGLGLAFLPHLAVARELRRATLVAVELADADPLRRSLDVIHPRHRSLSPEALAFLGALRTAARQAAPTRRRPRGAGQ